jgi:phenylacetate-CoA ligase
MRDIEGVGEFKVIQHALERIEVQVVPNAKWQDCRKDEIIDHFKDRLGKGVQVDIDMMDAIPPEASGKYRYVVSRVSLPGGLEIGK